MRWASHIASTGDRKVHKGIWRGDLRERENLGDLGEDGKIILKWIFKNLDEKTWTGLICLRTGTGDGLLLMR
jgi:hypothetical protein